MQKHKYIHLIEFVIENDSSFTIQQARDACKLSPREFSSIVPSVFALDAHQMDRLGETHESQNWVLKPEAYFGYLQYVQFNHAVLSANRAQWTATAALGATMFGLLLSLLGSI